MSEDDEIIGFSAPNSPVLGKFFVKVDQQKAAALDSRLVAMGKAGARISRAALKDAAAPMVGAMRSRVRKRTGLLGRSIKARAARGDRPGRVAVLITAVATRGAWLKSGRKAAAGRKSSKYRVYYARMVEKGHRILIPMRNAAGKGMGRGWARDTGRRVAGKPFMRPGFEATQGAVGEQVIERLDQAVIQDMSR